METLVENNLLQYEEIFPKHSSLVTNLFGWPLFTGKVMGDEWGDEWGDE